MLFEIENTTVNFFRGLLRLYQVFGGKKRKDYRKTKGKRVAVYFMPNEKQVFCIFISLIFQCHNVEENQPIGDYRPSEDGLRVGSNRPL